MRTLIYAATDLECQNLKKVLDMKPGPSGFWQSAKLPELFMLVGGPGLPAACMGAFKAQSNGMKRIINVGICGAFSKDESLLGQSFCGSTAYFGDLGKEGPEGFVNLGDLGIPSLDPNFCGPHPLNVVPTLPHCVFLSVATCSATEESARARREYWRQRASGFLCEDMETAALAWTARQFDIDCFAIRGVSNLCGVNDKNKWKLTQAAESAQQSLLNVLGKEAS